MVCHTAQHDCRTQRFGRDNGDKNIVSVDLNANVVPIRHNLCYRNIYDEADFICENADQANAWDDLEMPKNTLGDSMWARYGEGELDDYRSENETIGD